jgi:hypothetical protein
MTREQAEELARKLQAEQPERHFVVREAAGGDDPRTGHERRVPGIPGGL